MHALQLALQQVTRRLSSAEAAVGGSAKVGSREAVQVYRHVCMYVCVRLCVYVCLCVCVLCVCVCLCMACDAASGWAAERS